MQAETTPRKITFALPSILTLENVEDVYAELRKHHIQNGTAFVIDAEKLSSITTPGIQILLALARTVAQADGKFSIEPSSKALEESCRVLGLDGEYEAWTRKE